MAGRLDQKLMAIVADGPKGRIYLNPTPEQEDSFLDASPNWSPESPMNRKTSNLVSGEVTVFIPGGIYLIKDN